MSETSTPMKPPTIENIPPQLSERPQWICWRIEEREGRPTKVPYQAKALAKASSADSKTWSSLDEALKALRRYESYDGVGFVFSSADPFVGIDLDDCRGPDTGEIAPWAQKIIDAFREEGYVEASPSGTGVHIIIEAALDEPVKTKHVEIYSQARFFTITGEVLS